MTVPPLDVSVEVRVGAPPYAVANIMFDPTLDPTWMQAVKRVEPLGEPGGVGARVRRYGRFLGRTISWTTVVEELSPPHWYCLRIVDGPMRGRVEYEIEPMGTGSLVRIRNTGEASFRFVPRWLMQAAMRAALKRDLMRLARALEQGRDEGRAPS